MSSILTKKVSINFLKQVVPALPLYYYLAPIPLILLYRYLTQKSPSQMISQQFKQHNILITGAAGGLGTSFSLTLAKTNSTLFLTDINENALQIVAEECRDLGSTVFTFKADLSKKEDCKDLADFISKTLKNENENEEHYTPCLDFLLLSHGLLQVCDFVDIRDVSVFQRVININFISEVFLMHYLLPLLNESKHPKVLVMSSAAGKTTVPKCSSYVASKHALQGFFNSLRIELPHIQFTVCNPGGIPTDISKNAWDSKGIPYKERFVGPQSQKVSLFESLFSLSSIESTSEKLLYTCALGKRSITIPTFYKYFIFVSNIFPSLSDALNRVVHKNMPFKE